MRLHRSMLVLVPFLAACGGGGMGTHQDTVGGVRTAGVVLSVDGGTADLSGVMVGAPGADVWVLCDAGGHFDLGRLPPLETTFLVEPGDRPAIEMRADLRNCATVDIALAIDGERISRLDMEHCGTSHGMMTRGSLGGTGAGDWMGDLGGMMGSGHMSAFDGVTMHEDDAGHMGLAVEVAGFAPGATVEVVLVDEDGESVSLGVHTADADGVLRASWDAFGGRALPFGASHVHDLSGVSVEARDAATGELLFAGTLPEMGVLHRNC